MSADAALDVPVAVARPVADPWRRDRRFFTGMAVAAILVVFAGFFVVVCLVYDCVTR